MSNANTVVENMREVEISVLLRDKVAAYVTRGIIFPQYVRIPVRMSVNLILMTVVILNRATLSRRHMANNGLQKSPWRWMMQLVEMSYVSWILDQTATYCILTQNGSPPLKPTSKALRLYVGTSKLQALGTVNIMCSVKNNTEHLDFYIVDTDQTALLSAEACEKLELLIVNIVNSVDTTLAKTNSEPLTRSQLLNTSSDAFEGLGSFPG